MRSSDRRARWGSTLGIGAAFALASCASTQVGVRSDSESTQASTERIANWRGEVMELEARRIRGVDSRAYERARSWLDLLEGEDEPDVRALLVTVIMGELDVIRTAEQRYGPTGPLATPASERTMEESQP